MGFLRQQPRHARVALGLEENEAGLLAVGGQKFAEIAAGQIEKMDAVAQILQLIDEGLCNTALGLETGNENGGCRGKALDDTLPFRRMGEFIDGNQACYFELQPACQLVFSRKRAPLQIA
ncbi:hypothetical protein LGH82_12940 [Mesorhizobium sp. PAMC28654]|uniref:hypothetical protein n=1 Tax=Mesorhizobium sp. PAMC28654 TaxID=2880934 RepID=UPI001D099FDE|nr:hypothetical protein [Mesorhizobium sp. PAMC28654]UDL92054.1 hypothetical protein LGH82_12940 [Mesorhizobium sp. PAMC28654]